MVACHSMASAGLILSNEDMALDSIKADVEKYNTVLEAGLTGIQLCTRC